MQLTNMINDCSVAKCYCFTAFYLSYAFIFGRDARERGNDECVFICNFVIKTEFFFLFSTTPAQYGGSLLPTVKHLYSNMCCGGMIWSGLFGLGCAKRIYDGLRDYRRIVMVSKSVWWIFWICFECLFKLFIFTALFDVPLCYLFVWWWTLSSGSYAALRVGAFFLLV